MENRAFDRRILVSLERELQSSFRFEDGNGRSLNLVWVVCILLGRLLHEQTVLGRTIKQFAKFQRCEIMRGMVKLNDLEDMAEPPMNGGLEASSSAQRQQEGMDSEAGAGRGLRSPSNFLYGQEDINNGLAQIAYV